MLSGRAVIGRWRFADAELCARRHVDSRQAGERSGVGHGRSRSNRGQI
jgi:hypothetical protein